MSFDLSVPRNGEELFRHTIKLGDAIFLLGANGTGEVQAIRTTMAENRRQRKETASRGP